jgi:hypothetical protein
MIVDKIKHLAVYANSKSMLDVSIAVVFLSDGIEYACRIGNVKGNWEVTHLSLPSYDSEEKFHHEYLEFDKEEVSRTILDMLDEQGIYFIDLDQYK